MSLTAPVTTLLQFFLKRKGEERERIADYLDSIAEDAKGLAELWREILKKYNEGIKDPSADEGIDKAITDLGAYSFAQEYRFSKLEAFYEDISKVIGGKGEDELQSGIMGTLGALLQFRNLAKDRVEAKLAHARQKVFLDEENSQAEIRNIESAVLAMQREAASLEVLAKTYRATIRTTS
jgi:hypothetical protein